MSPERRVIDLSHSLDESTPPFPGDPAVRITVFDATEGAPEGETHVNASAIATSLHCGTHIDAPFHFVREGETIDEITLDRTFGRASRLQLPHDEISSIEPFHLEPIESALRETRRLIINTGWHRRWKAEGYFTEHPVLTGAAAEFLVACGTELVGVDFPSVDREPYPAHKVLLGAGVLIVENLTNLDALTRENFEFFAVPLKIAGRDGSPVRAFAIED